MPIFEIVMLILFIVSGGILYHERFKQNWFALGCAALLAMISTYYLTRQLVQDILHEELARISDSPLASPVAPFDPQAESPSESAKPPSTDVETKPRVIPSVPKDTMSTPEAEASVGIGRDQVEDVFRRYIAAWQAGDVSEQERMLDESFSYIDQLKDRQFRAAYLAQKRSLASRYHASPENSNIQVLATDIQIEIKGEIGSVTYMQDYRSPYYSSTGKNKFVMKKFEGDVRIVEEVFERYSYHLNE